MIGLIGHLGSSAVTACTDAPHAARASDRASRGAPLQSAPRLRYGCSPPSPRQVLRIGRNTRASARRVERCSEHVG